MLDGLRARYRAAAARVRRFERREWAEFRRWIEHTGNLVHLSALLFVPLLIAVVTTIANSVEELSFLLFPPLAAGTYTLFADPEGEYASPGRFVAGLTVGALCGWLALELTALYVYGVPPDDLQAHAGSAALSVFLTGVATWLLDVEEPSAYSTALLVLVTGTNEFGYVVSVGVSSALVAGVFLLWREEFYEERGRYLYGTVTGDDHVLVPMRGDHAGTVATFGAHLAAAHEAGKVVLLEVVSEEALDVARAGALAERAGGPEPGSGSATGGPGRGDAGLAGWADRAAGEATDDSAGAGGSEGATADAAGTGRPRSEVSAGDAPENLAATTDAPEDLEAGTDAPEDLEAATDAAAAGLASRRLEAEADRIETEVGVPCEVVVAAGDDDAAVTLRTAEETNCDLVVTAFESDHGALSEYVRRLFRAEEDVVALRPADDCREWRDVMVTVRRAGDVAHAMIDFATRLAGPTGQVSVCTCIDRESARRRAEDMLADLVETFSGHFETRVDNTTVEKFVDRNADAYDLVMVGASTDRSAASRFLSPPTFQRLSTVEGADVAVVHQGRP